MNQVVPDVRSSHSEDPPDHSEDPGRGGDLVELGGDNVELRSCYLTGGQWRALPERGLRSSRTKHQDYATLIRVILFTKGASSIGPR